MICLGRNFQYRFNAMTENKRPSDIATPCPQIWKLVVRDEAVLKVSWSQSALVHLPAGFLPVNMQTPKDDYKNGMAKL